MPTSPGLHLATATPEETRELGGSIATVLRAGDLVSLTGDLGAGKTTFVQGAASGLGVTEPILSPTFMLVREYRGSVPIYHLDVYRLERIQDVMDLGFEEMADRQGVVFVEWGDAIEAMLPPEHIQVEITMPDDSEGRRMELTWYGRSWAARIEHLAAAGDRWKV
jgi:tRNA threonylcarbamoyladenosine biosynthesis protein TsaE